LQKGNALQAVLLGYHGTFSLAPCFLADEHKGIVLRERIIRERSKKEMAGTNETITMMVDTTDIDEKILYERSKMLLKSYRFICWKTSKRADDIREVLECDYDYCSTDLNSALVYLENFAPDREKDQFARRIRNLFEVKWVVEIVDSAMMKVREYPDNGELYASILSVYYLSRFKFNVDQDVESEFGFDRSTFFRKKKEAIKVFGVALWGNSIDEFRRIMMIPPAEGQGVQQTIYDYYY
jgi:hypothetical protein